MPNPADGSHIHLDPEAINSLLAHLVNRPGEVELRYHDGRLLAVLKDVRVAVEAIEMEADGVRIRLRMLPAEGRETTDDVAREDDGAGRR